MDDPILASAHELATAIQSREVSSAEVVDAHLAQIDRHNARLNAVATLDEDGARNGAQEADAALGRGEAWGPLHGVPITLEDGHATSGVRSTWGGLPRLADHVPTEDGTVVSRLKAAGANLLGKTHGPEIWPDSVFASTNNPWDLTRTPGGSSAGCGAALAAGLTPLDIGLDSLGSIQNPSHYCGVYGMRPTEHRVPLTGVIFIGPIRKFRVMSVAGPDGIDTDVPPVPWRDPAPIEIRNLRIVYSSAFPESITQDEIRAAVEDVARELTRQGATVEERLPDVDLRRQYELGEDLFGLVASAFEEDAEHRSLDAYLAALDRRDKVITAWDEFFADWDALVAPAGTRTAERHEEGDPEPPEEYPYRLSALSGCPMVVIPAGVDGQGLSFGLQILGRRWEDERLLAIAELLSGVTSGFRGPPGY
ncbi:MAG: amidase [Actinomycetota bacterium]|nr:amidase [Actinomycetota bacterium]